MVRGCEFELLSPSDLGLLLLELLDGLELFVPLTLQGPSYDSIVWVYSLVAALAQPCLVLRTFESQLPLAIDLARLAFRFANHGETELELWWLDCLQEQARHSLIHTHRRHHIAQVGIASRTALVNDTPRAAAVLDMHAAPAVAAEQQSLYGVESVISGHDHDYERTKPIRGVTYFVSGAAGAPIRAVEEQHFSATVRTEPHYMLFDVSKRRMTMRAVNLKGETFDTCLVDALGATHPTP